jgi:LmbE family N-acetylglucosaminyl deacetylase
MEFEKPLAQAETILLIVAHPDDIEFSAGGAAAVWSDAGHRVVYVIITDGSAGSNDPDVRREDLVVRRQHEQRAAAAHVGVHEVRFLGYQDGMLQPTLELRRELTRIIRELKPYRVLIMDPTVIMIHNEQFDYINHPDHRAAGEAALYAVFPSAETRPIFPELLAEGFEPHHVSELYLMMGEPPNVAIDIGTVIERKIAALLAHESQLDASTGEMVRGWSAESGKQLGVAYAETFRVMRFIREQSGAPLHAQPGEAAEAAPLEPVTT